MSVTVIVTVSNKGNKGTFELHKWHLNVKELESAASEPVSEEETYAKEQLNVPRREGATLLGLPQDKENDTVDVSFPQEKPDPSKRGILSKVVRIYDPLGLASPISLGGNGHDARRQAKLGCKATERVDAELDPMGGATSQAVYSPKVFSSLTRGHSVNRVARLW